MSDMETLAGRPTFQRNLAHFTGMWRAARAGVRRGVRRGRGATSPLGEPLTPRMRADLRVAATYATEASPGGRRSGPTSRPARPRSGRLAVSSAPSADLYTGTQHAFISEKTYIDSAQIGSAWRTTSPASDQNRAAYSALVRIRKAASRTDQRPRGHLLQRGELGRGPPPAPRRVLIPAQFAIVPIRHSILLQDGLSHDRLSHDALPCPMGTTGAGLTPT